MKSIFFHVAPFLLFFLFLVLTFYSPLPAFSVFNGRWDGCSDFTRFIEGRGWKLETIYSLLTLNNSADPHGKLLVFLSPVEKLSDLEVETVRRFVYGGGSLLLADDFREGNSLSSVFGVKFSGDLLLEPSLYSKQPFFPLVNLTVREGFKRVYTLVLNHPSTLLFTGRFRGKGYYVKLNETWLRVNMSVQARSSGSSWLDVNYNLEKDGDEPRGSFPVVAFMSYGEGRVVVVSDPDIFINDMLFRRDNLAATNYILSYLAGKGEVTVYFCESKVWWVKPLSIYFLTFLSGWKGQPLLFRVSASILFSAAFSFFLLFSTVKSTGSPFIESLLGFTGGGEGGSEEVSEFEPFETDYNEYLKSFFEWFLKRLGVDLEISNPQLIYEEIVERYPSVKGENLKKLIELYVRVKMEVERVVNFKDFIRVCDDLLEVLERIGI